jgi:tetratricopeptide (TPR) repeat protein
MTVRGFLLCFLLTALCASPGWAGPAGEEPDVAAYQRQISAAKNKNEEALLRKKLGDYYASREDYGNASGEYLKALSLSPSQFTRQERLQMAIAVSWADHPDDAVRILRSILAENGENLQARIELARALLLADRLEEAEKEADRILKDEPDTEEALLVKANVLLWRGDAASSIPVYEKALAVEENFDARVGLASAYLAVGEKDKARETAKNLKPEYPYQEKELAKFSSAASGQRFWVGMGYSYYHDSDKNSTNRTGIWFGTRLGTWDAELAYRLADAHDPLRQEEARELLVIGRGSIGATSVNANAGIAATDSNGPKIGIGQVNGERDLGPTSIAAGLSHVLLTDTAELIHNRIVRTAGSISVAHQLASSLTLQGTFIRSSYSDDNSSNDLRLTVRYPFTVAAYRIRAGYQFRYWDFAKETRSGYFDPQQFMSHQLFVSLSWEQGRWYATIDPYFGYQSFTRYGTNTHELYGGFFGTAGWRLKEHTSVELNAEGGNYAGGSTAGYNYYLVGLRAVYGW